MKKIPYPAAEQKKERKRGLEGEEQYVRYLFLRIWGPGGAGRGGVSVRGWEQGRGRGKGGK